MSDHADIVREALRANGVMRYGSYERSNTLPALAALDALVAERDEARRTRFQADNMIVVPEDALIRAEARVTELETEMLDKDRLAVEAQTQRDEANVQWHKIRDLHADAVSEVARLLDGVTVQAEEAREQRERAEAAEAEVKRLNLVLDEIAREGCYADAMRAIAGRIAALKEEA